jgi:hypothetical protein
VITVVGADYSTLAIDLALVADSEIRDRAKVDLREPPFNWLRELIAHLAEWRRFEHASAIYLEAPWVVEGKGIQTALKLHKSANFLEAASIFAGLPAVEVHISTWRSQILGRTPKRAEAKRAAISYVKTVYGITTADDNLADAICIATYGVGAQRLAQRIGGKSHENEPDPTRTRLPGGAGRR